MKKFLIAGSSLAAVAAAGSAGAVDVTLGGTIDMGTEFGLSKSGPLGFSGAYSKVSLSVAAAGTTDGGLKYGGSFGLGTVDELEFDFYNTTKMTSKEKHMHKVTHKNYTDLKAAAYNVSGGAKVTHKEIVAVKINSDWKTVSDNTKTFYSGKKAFEGSSDICKIAGQLTAGAINGTRMASDGLGYMVAQKVAYINGTSGGANMTAKGPDYAVKGSGKQPGTKAGMAGHTGNMVPVNIVNGTGSNAGKKLVLENLSMDTGKNAWNASSKATERGGKVTAVVYAGPFMEVKLQSSTTKMVVGAVCVTGAETSKANYYMDNASKVVTASAAKIYVEGGFGKVTLQTSDYAGKVTAIGDAGDAADIDADGLVVIAEGLGLLGANPYIAADLSGSAGSLEVLTGGSVSFGAATVNLDMALGTGDDAITGVASWDAGASYTLGDVSGALALDSEGDFGASASMAVAGVNVGATIWNKSLEDHKKGGLQYEVTAAASLNSATMGVSYDQSGHLKLNVGYALGNLNVYAGYDGKDKGGKIGAKLSF